MRTMSDTMAQFAAFGARQGSFHMPGSSPSRLESLADFGSNPGRLRGHGYCPAGLARKAPLVVVLHGCKQNAGDYDHRSGWSQLADLAGFALLYPEQSPGNNPNLCFNWFRPGDTRRDSGEALSIRQMIDAMIAAHGLDRDRVFVTGLSAGGAMANVMLATYPEVFAGLWLCVERAGSLRLHARAGAGVGRGVVGPAAAGFSSRRTVAAGGDLARYGRSYRGAFQCRGHRRAMAIGASAR